MATASVHRGADLAPDQRNTPVANSIRVDSDTDTLKFGTGASGTTEKEVADTSSTQTLAGKSIKGPLPTLTPTEATVLTAAQSGTVVFLNAAAGFAITLPAVAAGLWFRFTVAAAFATTNFTVITPALADLIQGGATVAGADVPAADEDTISFVATAEVKGDFVEVWSDGTSWFVNGRGTTAGSITFTQAG